ncbi:ABC transporter ATP-binding protein [Geodermatophilus marinus]|uniref:ABC transporter ATP-binding protein n=1 Tax=Geodermatophilus sp. LHW52908 TaxID=2303986 RepID=UPI000E3D0739|nr:ABC transporter ATP-binding protein [Geodermatophilus sp. LHW52908]RFU18968.1 ABC transporter ATP-binding protein [Geodermatophilus sp. LHW52908]
MSSAAPTGPARERDPGPARPLTMSGVSKSFGPVRALVDADLELAGGEVHGLVGGNGAGKTTLMNVLYGLYRPDSGEIRVDGREVHVRSPRDAIDLGIGMVHQHLLQVSTYSVVENVVLGTKGGGTGGLRAAARRIGELSDRFGLAVDPRARTDRLSVGARQRVEILKVLYRGARVLVLDEPTTNLTPQEVDGLFASLREIVAEATSVVFISHKVREVLAICDRISVMRDGRRLTTVERSATDATGLASLMVGEPATEQSSDVAAALGLGAVGGGAAPGAEPAPEASAAARLTVAGLVVHNDQGVPAVHGVDLAVGAGEVLGVAGVAGNGQVELAEALAGVRRVHGGAVSVDGADLAGGPTCRWLDAGVAYVPEDRHRDGILGAASVTENLLLGSQRSGSYRRAGLLDWRRVREHARTTIDRYEIKTPGPDAPAGNLSGGNIQRLVLARAFERQPAVLVLQNPTRGLDLRSTRFVYDRVHEARDRGCAVVLISEDLDELSLLADRIVVLYSGRVVGERSRGDYDAYALGRLMAGVVQEGS